MLTEDYTRSIGKMMSEQANDLLETQHVLATTFFKQRTGRLEAATSGTGRVQEMNLAVQYPLHIRFLDLKKTVKGKNKKVYKPIYNKYVYGYLFIGIYRRLVKGISGQVRYTLQQMFEE